MRNTSVSFSKRSIPFGLISLPSAAALLLTSSHSPLLASLVFLPTAYSTTACGICRFYLLGIHLAMDNFRSYQNIQIPSAQGGTSSSSAPRKHDVFLSFRGEDTRHGFTGNLYADLDRKDLKVYMDDLNLPTGKIIQAELLQAIEESKSAIVILSENYADSTWCLDELAKIVECVETRDLILFPVFYRVDPSDVRKQRNKFDLAKYETDSGIAKDRVDSWRSALGKVGNIKGHHVKGTDRYERDYRDEIVQKISQQLEDDIMRKLEERVEMVIDKLEERMEMAIDKLEERVEMVKERVEMTTDKLEMAIDKIEEEMESLLEIFEF